MNTNFQYVDNQENNLVERVKKNFDLLIYPGNIGFYKSCEITKIFFYTPGEDKYYNLFTLLSFENTPLIKESFAYLTEKIKTISLSRENKIKWGILQRRISVERAIDIFDNLINNKVYQIEKPLQVSSLEPQLMCYVQANDEFTKPALNKVLKNNFHMGSYIIEFFDASKEKQRFLWKYPEKLNNLSEQINEIIPLHLGDVSDCIGNIIFQFPINCVQVNHKPIGNFNGEKIEINFSPELKKHPELIAHISSEEDNAINNNIIKPLVADENEFPFVAHGKTTLEIVSSSCQLLIFRGSFACIEKISTNIHIANPQNRCFYLNGSIQQVQVSLLETFSAGKEYNKNLRKWRNGRIYVDELNALEKRKDFLQYFNDNNIKALNDIRALISSHSRNGVYLWDPYLNAIDIKNTLYYCPLSNVPLRAITGLASKTKNKKEQVDEMRAEFARDDIRYLFFNIEVRGCFDVSKIHDWHAFHDRFLIFPLEKPLVWSLGISVNQLGKSHHILQKITHSQHILNAFNELWQKLDTPENLIWKHPCKNI